MATSNNESNPATNPTAAPGNTSIVDEKIAASIDKQIAKLAGKREAAEMSADISSIQTPFVHNANGPTCRFCGHTHASEVDVCESCGATYAVMLWVGYK